MEFNSDFHSASIGFVERPDAESQEDVQRAKHDETNEPETATNDIPSLLHTPEQNAVHDSINASTEAIGGSAKTGGRRGRGGRRSIIKLEPLDPGSMNYILSTGLGDVPSHGLGSRGGRGPSRGRGSGRARGSRVGLLAATSRHGAKQKRKNGRGGTDGEDEDTDSSEEINLPASSSSGRKITQANSFSHGLTANEPPSNKKPRLSISTPRKGGTRNMRRRPSAGAGAVCRSCGRGHSPSTNQIVFCDQCDTPWHQFCHDVPIPASVVHIESKEWRCADCDVLQEERLNLGGRVDAPTITERTGMPMGLSQKRKYFQKLDKRILVSLLLRASSIHDDLALFEPNAAIMIANSIASSTAVPVLRTEEAPIIPQHPSALVLSHPTTTSNEAAPAVPTATTTTTTKTNTITIESDTEDLDLPTDEDNTLIYEEPLPYPKMGHGLRLPPEEDDLDILVDEDTAVWSHSWQEKGNWVGALADQSSVLPGGHTDISTLAHGIIVGA